MNSCMLESVDQEVYWNFFTTMLFDKIVRGMKKDITEDVSEFGLTTAHVPYLLALNLNDGQSLVSMSHFLEMDRANTTRVIKNLEDRGLVISDRHYMGERNAHIFLSEEGRKVSSELFRHMVRLNERYFSGIPESEILHVKNILIKMFQNISRMMKEEDSENDSFYFGMGVIQSI